MPSPPSVPVTRRYVSGQPSAVGVLDPGGPNGTLGRPPLALTSLVGRDEELAGVGSAIGRSPTLCLTGPGGCGKSRIALAVAERVRREFDQGVCWIDLAPLADPDSLPAAVAAALQVRETPGRPLLHSLVEHVQPQQLLIVLDNCEHLLDTSAELVGYLLGRCPRLRVLSTSREALGLPGEVTWPVPPLQLPVAGRPNSPPSAAVQLFCERAAAVLPGFTLTDDNAADVARICRRLDGIPLAIELAAARVRVLSVPEIADRLDDRLGMLVATDRGGPARHRTLRSTLDWSYRLLTDPEKRLLAELSVFAGGFTLEGVEAIREPTRHRAGGDALDLLTRLVDRSLVVVAERGPRTRYQLLETIRLYAAERLDESGVAAITRVRLVDYVLALVEAAGPALSGPDPRGSAGRRT